MMMGSSASAQTNNAASFAVVELFASEGCSSCPPADVLLQTLAQEASAKGQHFYPLTFAVDYWDYLGWKDPASDAAFTRRQQEYARAPAADLYTPQMIINGQENFVGSDERKARTAIAKYLAMPAATEITAGAMPTAEEITIVYKLSQSLQDFVLHVALVEHHTESHPTKGENSGATLTHTNIVRAFKTVPVTDRTGTVILARPQEDDLSPFSVIVYAQSLKDLRILAASEVALDHP